MFRHNRDGAYERITVQPNSGLVKVDALGAGVLLVKKEVFKRIRNPYFFYEIDRSEDVNFCHYARMCGFDIHCDTDLDILHIGKQRFGIRRK